MKKIFSLDFNIWREKKHKWKCNCGKPTNIDLFLHAAESRPAPSENHFVYTAWRSFAFFCWSQFPCFSSPHVSMATARSSPPRPPWADPRSSKTCGEITRPPLSRIMAPPPPSVRILQSQAKLVLDNKKMPWHRKHKSLCREVTIKMAWPLALATKLRHGGWVRESCSLTWESSVPVKLRLKMTCVTEKQPESIINLKKRQKKWFLTQH